jgi:activator of HSP90 ATPase
MRRFRGKAGGETESACSTPTRRSVLGGIAVALSSLSAGSYAAAKPQKAEKEMPGAESRRTSLHQEIALNASPARIYAVLLDSKLFAAFSGLPAEIDPKAGGAFSMFGKMILGRNVELIPDKRIVQAWRPASWNPGEYSIVRFELAGQDSRTNLILDHTGFPEGKFADLDSGWHERYWEPLKRFLA